MFVNYRQVSKTRQLNVITARIRRMGKVPFSVCQFTSPWGDPAPHLDLGMGYPPSAAWGPPIWTWDGVPPPRLNLGQTTLILILDGGPLSAGWGTPHPDLRWGYPPTAGWGSRPGMGYPPVSGPGMACPYVDLGWGMPPYQQDRVLSSI